MLESKGATIRTIFGSLCVYASKCTHNGLCVCVYVCVCVCAYTL